MDRAAVKRWGPLFTYVGVALVSFLWLASPPGRAVPAMTGGPVSPAWASRLSTPLLRGALEHAVPGLGRGSASAPSAGLDWRGTVRAAGGTLTGVYGVGASAFLKAVIPGIPPYDPVDTADPQPVTVPPPSPTTPAQTASGPFRVLVYHSHAKESFLSELPYAGGRLDAAFTENPEKTVVKVGEALCAALNAKGIPAVQSRVMHDRLGRLGAYVESAKTIEQMLAKYPSIDVLVDVHRDATRRVESTAVVGGKTVAKLMLVVGTANQLSHPNWRQNLDFARKFIGALERSYPGMSLGIVTKDSRYNQHYSPQALLLEVGGPENTMEEAIRSAQIAAEVLAKLLGR